MPIALLALVPHVEAEEDDPRGAGERGEVDRLIAAVAAVCEMRRRARNDGERVEPELEILRIAALAFAALDRDAAAGEGLEFRLGAMPALETTVRVVEEIGRRRDLVGRVYRDNRKRPAVAIAARAIEPSEAVAERKARPAAQDDDAMLRPGALDDGKLAGAPEDFFAGRSPARFCSVGPAGLRSVGPIGLPLTGLIVASSTRPRPTRWSM
jgi:hypothetical protein